MSYRDQLVTEVNAQLDSLAAVKGPWNAKWITHSICSGHAPGLAINEDADFWRYAAYEHTRKVVRECINQRAGDSANRKDAAAPKLFPDFERDYLQDYYLVNRDGEDVGIFVGECSDEELQSKADLYRSQAKACFAHADEIERFIAYRQSRASVAA